MDTTQVCLERKFKWSGGELPLHPWIHKLFPVSLWAAPLKTLCCEILPGSYCDMQQTAETLLRTLHNHPSMAELLASLSRDTRRCKNFYGLAWKKMQKARRCCPASNLPVWSIDSYNPWGSVWELVLPEVLSLCPDGSEAWGRSAQYQAGGSSACADEDRVISPQWKFNVKFHKKYFPTVVKQSRNFCYSFLLFWMLT